MAILAHPANVDPDLQKALSRWLNPMPKLAEQEVVEGALGRATDPRISRILESGKGPLLRRLLGMSPRAGQGNLFSFEEMKDILRDSRKVKVLEDLLDTRGREVKTLNDLLKLDPSAGGYKGESKGQTTFEFRNRPDYREAVVAEPTYSPGKASPPDMVGPDVNTVPGPKMFDKPRWIEGKRGRFAVKDKLFGERLPSDTVKGMGGDVLQESLDDALKYNATKLTPKELRGFIDGTLDKGQMKAVATKLLKPKAGVDEVRYSATGKLFQQGKVVESEIASGKAGGPALTKRILDGIRDRIANFRNQDVQRMVGQDVLAGMTDKERKEFLRAEKESVRRAKGSTRPENIFRVRPDLPDLPESEMQRRVKALVAEYKDIVGKKAIHPDKLMAGIAAGPGRAKSIEKFWANEQGILDKLWKLDQQFADKESWSLATKFGEALIQENPGLTEKQLATVMPNLLKRLERPGDKRTLGQAVAQFSANSAENSAAEAVGKGERMYQMQLPGRGKDLTGVAGSLKERTIDGNNPMGWEREGDRAFMAEEVEAARAKVRKGKTPVLEVLPPGKAPPAVNPAVAKVLAEQARLKTILPAAADTRDAYVATLARANAPGPWVEHQAGPLQTFQGVISDMSPEGVDGFSEEDVWGDEVRSGRRGQSELERLYRRPAKPTSELREVLSRGSGLPPSDPKRLRKLVERITKTVPEFQGKKAAEILRDPGEATKALKVLTHRDEVVGSRLKRALEMVRAGEPEAVAMAGLGKQLQQILRMFITKL